MMRYTTSESYPLQFLCIRLIVGNGGTETKWANGILIVATKYRWVYNASKLDDAAGHYISSFDDCAGKLPDNQDVAQWYWSKISGS